MKKKLDTPSEKFEKAIGDLDYIDELVVTNIDRVEKYGKLIKYMVKEAKTYPIPAKNKLKQSTKLRNDKHPKKQSITPKTKNLDTMN